MPRNPSGSYSRRKPTPRSGSTTRPPARRTKTVAPPAPEAPPAHPPPQRRNAWYGLLGFLLAFILVHIALDLYLGLAPGSITRIPGLRLLEIFGLWFPILLLASFMSFGAPGRVSWKVRSLVLGAFVLLLVGLLVPLFGAPDAPCNADPDRADCIASGWFDFLLRFAPIPAFFFVFARGYQWSLSRCIGLAFILFSTWRALYGSFPDLLVIAAGGGTPGPTPTMQFYVSFFLKTLWDVVYPIIGLLFFFHRMPWIHQRPAWGDQLARLLRPMGNWIRRSLTFDLGIGGLLFFANVVATAIIFGLLSRTETEGVGDDSRVFDLLTFDQIFLLSIIAGVGEEFVYRGLLQGGLERLLAKFRVGLGSAPLTLAVALGGPLILGLTFIGLGAGDLGRFRDLFLLGTIAVLAFLPFAIWKGPTTVAIFIQSIAFAVVHAGYTDLNHVILPYLFGVFMGVVYKMFGLLPAILIHVEIDIVAFGNEYAASNPESAPALYTFLGFLILGNLVVGLLVLLFSILNWYEGRRRVLIALARS